jgi:hypothetical protein
MGSLIGVESSVGRALPAASSQLLALMHQVGSRVRLQRDPCKRQGKSAAWLFATPPSRLLPVLQFTPFRFVSRVAGCTSLPQSSGSALRTALLSPEESVPSEGSDVPIAEVPPNQRIQPTSVSSLRSSPAAADPCRYASRRGAGL